MEFNLRWIYRHFFTQVGSAKGFNSWYRNWAQDCAKVLSKHGKGKIFQLEERTDITDEEFRHLYLMRHQPVVLRGAAKHWPCMEKWTLNFLETSFGEDTTPILDNRGGVEEVEFKEVIRSIASGIPVEGNSKYSRFNTLLWDHPELKADFCMDEFESKIHHNADKNYTGLQLFLGGANTRTPLHSAFDGNLFLQIYGKKHWLIYPSWYNCVFAPENEKAVYLGSNCDPRNNENPDYPLFPYVDGYEVTLEPGDVLFNPAGYWHDVYNPVGSIGLGYRWVSRSTLRHAFMHHFTTCFSTNPPITCTRESETNYKDFSTILAQADRKPESFNCRLVLNGLSRLASGRGF